MKSAVITKNIKDQMKIKKQISDNIRFQSEYLDLEFEVLEEIFEKSSKNLNDNLEHQQNLNSANSVNEKIHFLRKN